MLFILFHLLTTYQIWFSLIKGSSNPSTFSTSSLLLRLAVKLHRAAANQNTVAEMKQLAPVESSHWSGNIISLNNCRSSTLLLHKLLSKTSNVKPEKRLSRRRLTPTAKWGRPTFSLNPMHAENALNMKKRNPPMRTSAENARAAFHFESMSTLSEYPKQPAYQKICWPSVAATHWAYRQIPKWSVKESLMAVNFKKSHLKLPIKLRRKAVAPKTSAPKLNTSQLWEEKRMWVTYELTTLHMKPRNHAYSTTNLPDVHHFSSIISAEVFLCGLLSYCTANLAISSFMSPAKDKIYVTLRSIYA